LTGWWLNSTLEYPLDERITSAVEALLGENVPDGEPPGAEPK